MNPAATKGDLTVPDEILMALTITADAEVTHAEPTPAPADNNTEEK